MTKAVGLALGLLAASAAVAYLYFTRRVAWLAGRGPAE